MKRGGRLTGPARRLLERLGFNTACLPNRTLTQALECGADLGMGTVELLSFADYRHTAGDLAGLYFDRLSVSEVGDLRALVSDFDNVSVHAPFWDIGPFSPNPGIREESRRQLVETLRISGGIGAKTATTHVVPRQGYQWHEYRDDVISFYRDLGDVADEAGITVTIETGYPREIDEFAALIHDIDHEQVGANIDVGHLRGLLDEGQRDPAVIAEEYNALLAEHVQTLDDRIYHLHLHDVHAQDVRDHRECGTGIVDYEALFTMLLDRDYEGLAVFELEATEDDVGALRRSRDRIADAIEQVGASH